MNVEHFQNNTQNSAQSSVQTWRGVTLVVNGWRNALIVSSVGALTYLGIALILACVAYVVEGPDGISNETKMVYIFICAMIIISTFFALLIGSLSSKRRVPMTVETNEVTTDEAETAMASSFIAGINGNNSIVSRPDPQRFTDGVLRASSDGIEGFLVYAWNDVRGVTRIGPDIIILRAKNHFFGIPMWNDKITVRFQSAIDADRFIFFAQKFLL
jgi:hypothetical protein